MGGVYHYSLCLTAYVPCDAINKQTSKPTSIID